QRRSIAAQEAREELALAAREPFPIPDQSEAIQPGDRKAYTEAQAWKVAESMRMPQPQPPAPQETSPLVVNASRDARDLILRQPRSLFLLFFGYIAAGLAILFAIVTVVSLVKGDFEAVLGGVLLTALLGWVARDWIGGRVGP